MTTRIFHNGHVLTERGFERDVCVVVEDGFIVALLHGEPPAGDLVDLDGGYLVPGFIDAQVNGGGGVLFNNDTSVDAIAAIDRAHRRFGTTGFLPTLISDDAAVMQRAITATRDAIEQGVPGVLCAAFCAGAPGAAGGVAASRWVTLLDCLPMDLPPPRRAASASACATASMATSTTDHKFFMSVVTFFQKARRGVKGNTTVSI